MKTICMRTGLELTIAPQHFSSLSVQAIHPIFLLRKTALLEIIRNQFPDESIFGMSEVQKKLILLALLNSLDLIEFRPNCIADPEVDKLVPNLEKIICLAESSLFLTRNKDFPKIAVSETIDNLSGLEGFLESIMADAAGIRANPDEIQESILNRIQMLSRAVSQGAYDKEKSLRSSVAAWAIEATKSHFKDELVSKEIQTYWKEMLKSSPADIAEKATAAADVAELEDFMISYLPHGSTASYEVLRHIEALKTACGSLGSYLFGSKARVGTNSNPDSFDEFDIPAFVPKSAMPLKGNFKDTTEWLAALKEWNIASRTPARNEPTNDEELKEELKELKDSKDSKGDLL